MVGGDSDCLALEGTGPPQIVQAPLSESAVVESSVLLVGNAFGAAIVTYQWKFNGTNLDGATQASLLLTNLQMQQSGMYSFTASNAWGGPVESPASPLSV